MTFASGDFDVAVIGAGAAGVAAGQAFAKAGVSFVVLEARPRAGGRAWTGLSEAAHTSYPVDLGCGWIHSADRNPLVPAARQLGFTVDETAPPWQREMPEDGFPASRQRSFRSAQENFYERMQRAAAEPRDRAASELLDPQSQWAPLINAVSTYVNGVELDRLSVKDFDNYHDTGINFRVVEG